MCLRVFVCSCTSVVVNFIFLLQSEDILGKNVPGAHKFKGLYWLGQAGDVSPHKDRTMSVCVFILFQLPSQCVFKGSCVLIIYRQLQPGGSSSHSSWCMLIEQPEAKTVALIYKLIQLVLLGIDLSASPSVKSPWSLFRVTEGNKGMDTKKNDKSAHNYAA